MSNTDGRPFIPCTSSRPSGVAKDERNFVGSAAVALTKLTRDLFWQAVTLLTDKSRRDGKTTWLTPGLVGRVRYLWSSKELLPCHGHELLAGDVTGADEARGRGRRKKPEAEEGQGTRIRKEVTMAQREKHDKSRKRKPDELDQPHQPVRDVQEDPAPNPDDASGRRSPAAPGDHR